MTTTTAPPAPTDGQVAALLATYGAPDASVGQLLCDRHPAEATAFRVVSPELDEQSVTYGELADASRRVAAGLAELGVGSGDRVATLLGKSVEHLVSVLAIWRLGAVHVPLFTAFAAPAIDLRLRDSQTKVVVCDATQRAKLPTAPSASAPRVVSIDAGQPADVAYRDLAKVTPLAAPVAAGGDAPLIQLYTSGTTGRPKPVVVPVRALASIHAYMTFGLDVHADDVFWNAADPGWAYGHYYGLTGPLAVGVSGMWLQGGFDAKLTWRTLARFGVTNLAAAPTVYRQLRATAGPTGLRLRCASAAGEPLTPEINDWARQALGVPVHDHYGQTETGMLVNNHHHRDLRAPLRDGSMGRPMPGWTVTVLDDNESPADAGVVGRIAVDRTASPLAWFDGYAGDPAGSSAKFTGDGRWYLTGDTGTVDDDGYFRFLSRDDDVILMAGYRIGPADVESVLLAHPAVAEAAVVGVPDPVRGEVLVAAVVLIDGTVQQPDLAAELQQLVKTRLAAHAYPREVRFVVALPRTPSGKLQRFVVRQQWIADGPDGTA